MRYVVAIAAMASSLLLTAVAAVVILNSPDSIDDPGPYTLPDIPPAAEPVLVAFEAGESPGDMGERLEEMGVIESAEQFRVLVSFLGYDGILQAGEYEFRPDTPALDVVYRMRRGITSTRSVTIVEGWRLEEVADAFAAQGIDREEFLAAAEVSNNDLNAFGFLTPLLDSETVEGYLYPATYPLNSSDTAATVLKRILQAFTDNAYAAVPRGGAGGLSLHEIVTLASIIEREARIPEERPIMAQVFLKRLAEDIPLEADPTVQYAVSFLPRSVAAYGYWKKELTAADLGNDSPYNTYQVSGLPPGPICSPRLDSILAVVNPSDTNFLYFVARADGSHLFAETFEEHLENVRSVEEGE